MNACVGGGSNAIGFFFDFLEESNVRLVVEAGGTIERRRTCRAIKGKLGVLQGCKTWILQNSDGQINPTHSVLRLTMQPLVEHAYYRDLNRIEFAHTGDEDALQHFKGYLLRKESCQPWKHPTDLPMQNEPKK